MYTCLFQPRGPSGSPPKQQQHHLAHKCVFQTPPPPKHSGSVRHGVKKRRRKKRYQIIKVAEVGCKSHYGFQNVTLHQPGGSQRGAREQYKRQDIPQPALKATYYADQPVEHGTGWNPKWFRCVPRFPGARFEEGAGPEPKWRCGKTSM